MSIPTTQKVILINENGDYDVLKYEDFAVPKISDTEVLVKNAYAGVNFIEGYFRTGLYPSEKPYVLGREASGTVVAVGSQVTKFAVGDKIAYAKAGAFAQYTAVEAVAPGATAWKLPADTTDEQLKIIAGSIIQGLTTYTFIHEAYEVKPNDYILVHAAAGGCGLLFTQLIKLKGAHVIGTVSTPEKAALAKAAGADHVINYSTPGIDIAAEVKKIVPEGVHGVFDGVGKDTFESSLAALRRKGTLVSFGNASGAVPPVPLFSLTPKNLKLCRPTVFNYLATDEEVEKYSSELFDLINSGKLKIDISKVYPLSEYKQAAKELEGRKTTGKLVLQIP